MARNKETDWRKFKDKCWNEKVEDTIDDLMVDINNAHEKQRDFEKNFYEKILPRYVKKDTIAYIVAAITFITILFRLFNT
jgi:hypothetical protein